MHWLLKTKTENHRSFPKCLNPFGRDCIFTKTKISSKWQYILNMFFCREHEIPFASNLRKKHSKLSRDGKITPRKRNMHISAKLLEILNSRVIPTFWPFFRVTTKCQLPNQFKCDQVVLWSLKTASNTLFYTTQGF